MREYPTKYSRRTAVAAAVAAAARSSQSRTASATMGRWLRRYRNARAAAGIKGGPHDVPVSPVNPAGSAAAAAAATDFEGYARRGVAAVEDDTRNENTDAAYSPKVYEFFEFADYTRPMEDEASRYLVSFHNIFGYVWYHAFRAKRSGGKKSGKKRKRGDAAEPEEPEPAQRFLHFVPEEYDKLCLEHKEFDRMRTTPLDPENGVSYSEMEHVKNSLKRLFEEQVSDKVTALNWDHIWTLDVKNLMLMVKRRRTRIAIKNNQEKMDITSSPYMIVARIKDIEKYIWNGSFGATNSQIHSALRNRYVYLRSLGTIARGETLHGEELSDHFLLEFQGAKDPHQMEIDVSQVAHGKMNQNYKQFSRATRHADVLMCGFGAYAFYLYWRFAHSKEFDPPNIPDFTDASTWFKIKSLVCLYDKASYTKGIKDKNYADFMKSVLKALGLPQSFLLHIGRKVGSVSLELKELSITLLKQFGNWNQSMFDKAYSAKIPLEALRVAADFVDGFFFCPRTVVVTANLYAIEETVWPWVEDSLAIVSKEFEDSDGDLKLFTAFAWLTYMKRLKRVLVQDAAFILEFHPERAAHPLFQMPLFNTDLFRAFRIEMRQSVEAAVSPLDRSMDRVLPGVLQMLRANAQLSQQILQNVNTMHGELRSNFRTLHADIAGNDTNLRNSFGRALATAGNEIMQSTPLRDSLNEGDVTGGFGNSRDVAQSRRQEVTVANQNGAHAQSQAPSTQPFDGFGYVPNFSDTCTVQKIYDQWYGKNAYKNIPVAGGIAQMELRHKFKWRKPWNTVGKSTKMFSRMGKIMKELHRLRRDFAFTPQQAITVMDLALRNRKGVVTTFSDLIGKVSDAEFYGDLQSVQDEEDVERAAQYEAEEAHAMEGTDDLNSFLRQQEIPNAVSEDSDTSHTAEQQQLQEADAVPVVAI